MLCFTSHLAVLLLHLTHADVSYFGRAPALGRDGLMLAATSRMDGGRHPTGCCKVSGSSERGGPKCNSEYLNATEQGWVVQ